MVEKSVQHQIPKALMQYIIPLCKYAQFSCDILQYHTNLYAVILCYLQRNQTLKENKCLGTDSLHFDVEDT